MKIAGLTGGIACGKSTVSKMMASTGLIIVDCDELAHEVQKKGTWGYKRVVNSFGPEILDESGNIDRKVLGDIVFNDAAARRRLNQATHLPIAWKLVQTIVWHWFTCRQVVVLDMPLLFETETHLYTKPNIVVWCGHQAQVRRLMSRDGCDRKAAEAKISSQMDLEEKKQLADIIIDNSGSLENTEKQVAEAVKKIKGASWMGWFASPLALGTCVVAATVFASAGF